MNFLNNLNKIFMTKRSLEDKINEVFGPLANKRPNFSVVRSSGVSIGDDNVATNAPGVISPVVGDDNLTTPASRATSPVVGVDNNTTPAPQAISPVVGVDNNTTPASQAISSTDSIIPTGADSGFVPRQGSGFGSFQRVNQIPQNPETVRMPPNMSRQDRSYERYSDSPNSDSSDDEHSSSHFDAGAGSVPTDVTRQGFGSSNGAGVSGPETTIATHQRRVQVRVVNDPEDPLTALYGFADLRINSFRAIRSDIAQSASQGEQLGSSRPVSPQGEQLGSSQSVLPQGEQLGSSQSVLPQGEQLGSSRPVSPQGDRPSGSDDLFDLSALSALLGYVNSPTESPRNSQAERKSLLGVNSPTGSPRNSQAERESRSGVNSPSQE